MKTIKLDIKNIVPFSEKTILCLGYFDGLHIAHQDLIKSAIEEGYEVAILTFDISPKLILNETNKKVELSSLEDKSSFLSKLGVDHLLLLDFDLTFAALDKGDFIRLVLNKLNPYKIYCGEDYRFGYKGKGDASYLSSFFNTRIIEIEKFDGMKISSSSICQFLLDGDIESSNRFLGRNYQIKGKVVEGNKIGRTINFPTANLDLVFNYVVPKIGVYIGYALINEVYYKCLIQIGTHPTIKELTSPLVEIHVLNFDQNIYGNVISVEFVSRLRDEIKFSNLDSLRKQLDEDRLICEKLLSERKN